MMRSALFWVVSQRVAINHYRRFGTSYGGPIFNVLVLFTPKVDTDRFSRNVGKDLPLHATKQPGRAQIVCT
jgi:hypothetical protein